MKSPALWQIDLNDTSAGGVWLTAADSKVMDSCTGLMYIFSAYEPAIVNDKYHKYLDGTPFLKAKRIFQKDQLHHQDSCQKDPVSRNHLCYPKAKRIK